MNLRHGSADESFNREISPKIMRTAKYSRQRTFVMYSIKVKVSR